MTFKLGPKMWQPRLGTDTYQGLRNRFILRFVPHDIFFSSEKIKKNAYMLIIQ